MNQGILKFMNLAVQLKVIRRQGWIDRGVEIPESTADHSWSVALLAWMLARDREDLRRDRVMLLGLVHDLPEALAGDVTPFDGFRDAAGLIAQDHFQRAPDYEPQARATKQARERAALDEMLAQLPDGLAGEIRAAWEEYERAETPEARFVKQVDKLETLIQAEAYAASQPGLSIESFRQGTRRDVTDPQLAALVEALLDSAGDTGR